jgi:hypothetical protein
MRGMRMRFILHVVDIGCRYYFWLLLAMTGIATEIVIANSTKVLACEIETNIKRRLLTFIGLPWTYR